MVERLHVALTGRGYDILVGSRLLAEAGRHIKPLIKDGKAIIVSDEQVARLYLHRLTSALEQSGIDCGTVIVPAGESTKSLGAFSDLLETLLAQRPDRNTVLIALGGGVVGDVTGFAASVLLRGIGFVQIPTTLLAQVDSSVGGKTGINSKLGKNLIGSFHQPLLVLSDVSALSTLPERERRAGYAEIVKYGLISDEPFFRWLEKNGQDVLAGDEKALTHAILTGCKAKAAIVEADEREAGARALLNFGHTFAHALEAECGYGSELLHGEAVAIGMALAFHLSVNMGLCPPEDFARVTAHLKQTGLPSAPFNIRSQWDADKLLGHFERDKKASGGALTFILTHGIGKAFIARDVEKSLVKQALVEACAGV